jgi:hypothetical protein
VRFAVCDISGMRMPDWLREVPQPLRSAVAGMIGLAGVGAIYGLVESARDYPLSGWFGVTLYVAFVGAVAGFLIGLIAGAFARRS